MKVKTSPYERAINRLAQGTPKDCDLADELEQACRASMKERLAIEARIAAAVTAERERAVRVADEVFARWGRPEYGLLRGDVEAAIRGAK